MCAEEEEVGVEGALKWGNCNCSKGSTYSRGYITNPFVPNAPFLYPYSFLMFSGVEKGCIRNEWAKEI